MSHTPQIGWYRSSSMDVISWQIKQIKRLNIDYVVFEMLASSDWCFQETVTTIEKIIPLLLDQGIGYTFLLDVWVDHDNSQSTSFDLMLEQLKQREWLVGVEKVIDSKPLIYVFNADCDQASLITSSHPEIDVKVCAWIPTWKSFESVQESLIKRKDPHHLDKFFGKYWHSFPTAWESLERLGYCQFWQLSNETRSMNGIASVIPGYDDLLMNRIPQMAEIVPRNDGHTLVEQFKRAVESGADNILIYGWNEYFEATTIEPTLEYGDFYVKLTRRLIEQAKRGEPIHFPENMGNPQPAVPIYLTPELERAAQRHPDKVPRWDQDDYVAAIDVLAPAVRESGHVFFRGVRVSNVGLKTWRIKTEGDKIRLGVRLYDPSKSVVREGRAELSDSDIPEGQSVRADLSVEIDGLVPGNYLAEIDLVWEEKFWFKCSITKSITLF